MSLMFFQLQPSGSLSYSFHEMKHKPFLRSIGPKTQNMRKKRGKIMESGKCGWELYDEL
jgi:hypothetical protein